jgi:hypothetical protein
MKLSLVKSTLLVLAGWFFLCCLAAPTVTLTSNMLLDPRAIFFVSYDGVVNVNSFQLSGLLTFGSFQYAGWYTSTSQLILARRSLSSTTWSTLALPHNLTTQDSHNVVALGVSPQDGRIHVAFDCHSTDVFYTVSEAGLATTGTGNSWVVSRFAAIANTIGTLNVGTYVFLSSLWI